MDWIKNNLIMFVIGSGAVIFAVIEALRWLSATVKSFPAWLTRLTTVILGTAIVALTTYAKATFSCDVNDVVNTCLDALANNQGAIKVVLSAVVAFGLNWIDAKRKAAST